MRGDVKSTELVSNSDEEDNTTQPPVASTEQRNDAAQPLITYAARENNATLSANDASVAELLIHNHLNADQTAFNVGESTPTHQPTSDDDDPRIKALEESQRKALQDAERFEHKIKVAYLSSHCCLALSPPLSPARYQPAPVTASPHHRRNHMHLASIKSSERATNGPRGGDYYSE